MNTNHIEPVMKAIRSRTETTPPHIRIHHLHGMAELADAMTTNNVRFPAILYGFVKAEAERLPPGGLTDTAMVLRILSIMEESTLFDSLARDDDALVWLVNYSRLPEYARYAVACRIGNDGLPEDVLAALRDQEDDRAAATFAHCLLRLSQESQVSLSVANALNEFRALPGDSQALVMDIKADYPRTFHILFSEPPAGEESFN